MDRMERNSRKDSVIRIEEVFEQLAEGDDPLHSEKYYLLSRAVEGTNTLNLNEMFRWYSTMARRKALAVVFKLVHSLPIATLLLQGNNIDDDSWEGGLNDVIQIGISELPYIKILDLSENSIELTGSPVALVGSTRSGIFPNLSWLSLAGNPIDLNRLRLSLKILSNLKILWLSSIHSVDALGLLSCWKDKSMANLQEIDLSGNNMTTMTYAALSKFHWQHLRILKLSNTAMNGNDLALLAEAIRLGRLKVLESIDLSANDKIGAGLVTLLSVFENRYLPKLKEISLKNCSVKDAAVSKLAEAITAGELQFLETLDLSRNGQLGHSAMVLLATSLCSRGVPLMKTLQLCATNFGEIAAVRLAEAITSGYLRFLTKLDISANIGMISAGLTALMASFKSGKVLQLQELHLSFVGMSADGLTHLAEAISAGYLIKLQKLDLSKNYNMMDAALVSLTSSFQRGKVTQLQELRLRDVGMGADGLTHLADAVSSGSLGALQKLDLSGNEDMTDTALASLTSSFQRGKVTQLQELCLCRVGMGADGLTHLAEAISLGNLRALQKLDLSENHKMTDAALVSLASSFQRGKVSQLQELLLRGVGMGADGLTHLAGAISLGNLKALQKLDLSENYKMMDAALVLLASSFQGGKVTQLQTLHLCAVGMGANGLTHLAEAISLGSLGALQKLDLSRNRNMTDAALVSLVSSLVRGNATQFQELVLDSVNMRDNVLKHLAEVISLGSLRAFQRLDASYNTLLSHEAFLFVKEATGWLPLFEDRSASGKHVYIKANIFQKTDKM